ncbi:DNA-binding transcriptional regulator, LysR family [Cohaesibacter sp. ES.047]|uniref:LysR family transcriptional regulator n=1 Tax=Cohaesibacter sp. ES.047 TaxID=1798205 RepID=UPI000BB98E6A|nr:LysR family transcriptional regulator [Cohaesibacter sp. ES.047]SNY93174.1 DNA-binding transcriptional regulator, LysR family [Cohaesibacter sp. ES.047]
MNNPWANMDWDLVRVFLTVAEKGSFKGAADTISMSLNTIRKTIERMEDQFGYPLFFREPNGLRLTAEGRRVVVSAREVQNSMHDLWRAASASTNTMQGPIRVAITEGLGTFWLIPQLSEFVEDVAGINRIELQCAIKSVDVMRLEADISVQLEEPTNPDLIRRKLGKLHLVPWASKHYIERFGVPKSIVDLAQHRIVEQDADRPKNFDLAELFGAGVAERMVAIKTNFSSAHYWAIAKGVGVGMLPSYARLIGGNVEPVNIPGLRLSLDIWMTCHPEVLKSARHRRFVDWLASCFNANTYPWFHDEFLPPEQIEEQQDPVRMKEYFDGFVAGTSHFVKSG